MSYRKSCDRPIAAKNLYYTVGSNAAILANSVKLGRRFTSGELLMCINAGIDEADLKITIQSVAGRLSGMAGENIITDYQRMLPNETMDAFEYRMVEEVKLPARWEANWFGLSKLMRITAEYCSDRGVAPETYIFKSTNSDGYTRSFEELLALAAKELADDEEMSIASVCNLAISLHQFDTEKLGANQWHSRIRILQQMQSHEWNTQNRIKQTVLALNTARTSLVKSLNTLAYRKGIERSDVDSLSTAREHITAAVCSLSAANSYHESNIRALDGLITGMRAIIASKMEVRTKVVAEEMAELRKELEKRGKAVAAAEFVSSGAIEPQTISRTGFADEPIVTPPAAPVQAAVPATVPEVAQH